MFCFLTDTISYKCCTIFRLSETEFYYSQSELEDLELLMQQINGFQRFTVSFIVLMLSNSYRSITKYMSIYTQKRNKQEL